MKSHARIGLVVLMIILGCVAQAAEITYEKKISGVVAAHSLERFFVKITDSNFDIACFRVGEEPEVESINISIDKEGLRQLLSTELQYISGTVEFRPLQYMSNEICETLTVKDNGKEFKVIVVNRDFLTVKNDMSKASIATLDRVTNFIIPRSEREKFNKLMAEIGSFKDN